MRWDPVAYDRFADERGRPFRELVARVGADEPRHVVDLGCGPGRLTATLARRWPDAVVEGVDASPEMVAVGLDVPGIDVRLGEIADWEPDDDVDVVVSNAALQWVPAHERLLRRWLRSLAPGAWLAWQVPDNFDEPSHVLMRELAGSTEWQSLLDGVLRSHDSVATPGAYARLVLDAGWEADVWATTYLHALTGPDPVLAWVTGTGLRPVLDALDPPQAEQFTAQYADLLRQAYPSVDGVTLYPFRRTFCVGHRPG